MDGSDSVTQAWVRSTRCYSEAHCVEVQVGTDRVLSRSSLRPSVELSLSHAQWACFVAGVKAGGYDRPALDI
ncbi:DUF397 domain-containing protein [Phytohabitans houttuyneae]